MGTIKAFCKWPWTKIKICPSGKLSMCCHQQHDKSLGNLFKNSFDEIWFGKIAQKVREETLKNKRHQSVTQQNALLTIEP